MKIREYYPSLPLHSSQRLTQPPSLVAADAFGSLAHPSGYRNRLGACANALKELLDVACLLIANDPSYRQHELGLADTLSTNATGRLQLLSPSNNRSPIIDPTNRAVACAVDASMLVEAFVSCVCAEIAKGASSRTNKQAVAKIR